jgi:hypothetical protein
MAVDAGGDVIVTGYTDTSTLSDILTVKFSGATGAEVWRQRFDDAAGNYDQAWALALDADGNAIVTGYAWTGSEYDIKVIKYAAADGAILWQTTFTGPMSGIDFGIAIGVDGAGNVIVGGNVWNGTDDDMVTVKFAAADGAVLWSQTFAGAAGAGDYVFALALDGEDNVIVTGEATESFVSTSDWKTIKYAAADGAVLWEASYAGAGNGLDIPYGIAVDAANDIVIAGNTHNGTDFDARIAKYAAATGAVLWEQSYAGAGGGDDMFYALALDAAGDALATGFSFDAEGGNDWNTVKYRGTDGTQVWAKTHAGSGNLSDVSVAIALDPAGNAIVGGRVNNSEDPGDRDMQAVKYAASDGAVLWSYAYAGSANGFDRVAALAARPGEVFLAGESLETGLPQGWRVVKLGSAIAPAKRLDFNADTRSDVLFRSAGGDNAVWQLNGLAIVSQGQLPALDSTWTVAGIGDFNGDGNADILWRQASSGANLVWHLAGSFAGGVMAILSQGELPAVDAGWTVEGTGDFNGDGKADVLWRQAASGLSFVWHLDGATIDAGAVRIVSRGRLPRLDFTWSVAGIGDFNGDGKADVFWRRASGTNYVLHVDGSVISGGFLAIVSQGTLPALGTSWTPVAVGDFNGDGKSDVLWRRNDGVNYVWHVDGAVISAGRLSIPSQGTLPRVDPGWTVAGHGDYNGDGKADVFWRRAAGGNNYLWFVDGAVITGGMLAIIGQGSLPVLDSSWSAPNPK